MPYQHFIESSKTVMAIDRNFHEWHNGVRHYGLWLIMIDDREWMDLVTASRLHMAEFLLPGYRRQPHVTLKTCGLLCNSQCSPQIIANQIQDLEKAEIRQFKLFAGHVDSFSTAPYISVECSDNSLERIRSLLKNASADDKPFIYAPHITLGFYKDTFKTEHLVTRMKVCPDRNVPPLIVKELAFCTYETAHIQGPLTVVERIGLPPHEE